VKWIKEKTDGERRLKKSIGHRAHQIKVRRGKTSGEIGGKLGIRKVFRKVGVKVPWERGRKSMSEDWQKKNFRTKIESGEGWGFGIIAREG